MTIAPSVASVILRVPRVSGKMAKEKGKTHVLPVTVEPLHAIEMPSALKQEVFSIIEGEHGSGDKGRTTRRGHPFQCRDGAEAA